jgi:hypothetical protein
LKKLLIAAVISALASSAWATGSGQSVSVSGLNSGAISNGVSAAASVTGNGISVSGATGAASASSAVTLGSVLTNTNKNCVTTVGGAGTITGTTAASVSGTAFNYSSGAGATGSAASVGQAVAHAEGSLKYAAPGQTLNLAGASDSGANGSVIAGVNQGGAFTNAADGSFTATGNVGSVVTRETTALGCGVKCGAVKNTSITGSVSDTKTANASVSNGTLTVTGLPEGTVLGNATVVGNAGSNTVVNANFTDPK